MKRSLASGIFVFFLLFCTSALAQDASWECGSRDRSTLKVLLKRLKKWKVRLFCTDDYAAYASEIPNGHLYQGKDQTWRCEQNNGRQRHWLARFRRKSIVVSKSIKRMNHTMVLFARFRVNGTVDDLLSILRQHPRHGGSGSPFRNNRLSRTLAHTGTNFDRRPEISFEAV